MPRFKKLFLATAAFVIASTGAQAQIQGCTDLDLIRGYTISKVIRAMAHPLRDDRTRKQTLLAYHRGAWEVEPDNSMSAYEAARRAKAEILEVDVRRDQNGKLWMIHDDVLNRVTNARNTSDPTKPVYIRDTPTTPLYQLVLRRRDGSITTEHMVSFADMLDWYYGKVLCAGGVLPTYPVGPVIALDVKGSGPKDGAPPETSEQWSIMQDVMKVMRAKFAQDNNNGWGRFGLGIVFKIHLNKIPQSADVFEKTLGVTGTLPDGNKDWDMNFLFVLNPEDKPPAEFVPYQQYKNKLYTIGFELNQNNPDGPMRNKGWYDELLQYQFSPKWGPLGGVLGRSFHQYLETNNYPEGRATGGACCRTNLTPGYYSPGPEKVDMKGYMIQFFTQSDVMTTDDPETIKDLYIEAQKYQPNLFRGPDLGEK